MVSAIQTIALSRDLVVIRAFELFHDQLLRGVDGALDQIEDGLKSVLDNVEMIAPMLQTLKLHADQPLPHGLGRPGETAFCRICSTPTF